MNDVVETLQGACEALTTGDLTSSRTIIQHSYPFKPLGNAGPRYSAMECTRVGIRRAPI